MDKQDELARVIGDASEGSGPIKVRRLPEGACHEVAAAVRSFMGSDEVVGKSAASLIRADHIAVENEVEPTTQEWGMLLARAAIRTALGGDGE